MINIKDNKVYLTNDKISYILETDDNKNLLHRYFGSPIRSFNGSGIPSYNKRGFRTQHGLDYASYDDYPFEYPSKTRGDYKIPAITVVQDDGTANIDLKFKEWRVLDKKPKLENLPYIKDNNDESETLEVVLEDKEASVELRLYYTIFENLGIIIRHQKISNIGDKDIIIENLQSASLEIPADNLEVLTLYGTHIKEANQDRTPVHHGIHRIESSRGVSSHHYQPFIALVDEGTNYNQGNVYGLHLVYSGNFEAEVEKDIYSTHRAHIGINKDTFKWILKPGESFETPEAILNFSPEGLNGMAQNFHTLYKEHLIPDEFKNEQPPVLLNSWEAMYYDVSEKKLKDQIDIADDLNIELYVLDDGWFRNNSIDGLGMGDWEVIEEKLPNGITGIADYVHDKGMKFGLWFEPEAISYDSNLIHEHPDWVLQYPNYEKILSRNEYLLDLSNKDVRDYLFNTLDKYISEADIDYVKWDMNRPITEFNSLHLEKDHKGELAHRYVLGLYELLTRLREKHPELLIEGCSSGGGRFDPGMLFFVPQNWTSDNTDAHDRTIIQEGMSLLYPPITMGAHVSASPNHQTQRASDLKTRFDVARLFNLGYELDMTQLSEDELKDIKKDIEEYKKERKWLHDGTFYQHDLSDKNYKMWSIVDDKKDKAIAVIFQNNFTPLSTHARFKFLGLDEEADYFVKELDQVFSGDELQKIGLTLPQILGDYKTQVFTLEKVLKNADEIGQIEPVNKYTEIINKAV